MEVIEDRKHWFMRLLVQIWKYHPWTSMFTCGPMDPHNGIERLCIFGFSWSAAVMCCGLFYGSGEDIASQWAVGILSVLMILPLAKTFYYFLAHSDSEKKMRLRELNPSLKAPAYSTRTRKIILALSVIATAAFTFLALIFAVQMDADGDDTITDWILSTLEGQAFDAVLIEPFLLAVKFLMAGKCGACGTFLGLCLGSE